MFNGSMAVCRIRIGHSSPRQPYPMKAILLAIARARSGIMRVVQNVAKTRLAAKYPTSTVGVTAQFPNPIFK